MWLQRQEARIGPQWTCAPGMTVPGSPAETHFPEFPQATPSTIRTPGGGELPPSGLTTPCVPAPGPAEVPESVRPEPMASPAASLGPGYSLGEGRTPRTKRWRRSRTSTTDRTPRGTASLERALSSWEPLTASEACGYAVRFAADYLSWDELEPARRGAALRTYLADQSMVDTGWSGRGRQRADLVAAGRTVELAAGRVVVVEVTARVVGYHRVDVAPEQVWQPPVGEATPPLAFAPASAPPPSIPGWEQSAAWWVRIAPPVRRDHDGRLVIDLGLDLNNQP